MGGALGQTQQPFDDGFVVDFTLWLNDHERASYTESELKMQRSTFFAI